MRQSGFSLFTNAPEKWFRTEPDSRTDATVDARSYLKLVIPLILILTGVGCRDQNPNKESEFNEGQETSKNEQKKDASSKQAPEITLKYAPKKTNAVTRTMGYEIRFPTDDDNGTAWQVFERNHESYRQTPEAHEGPRIVSAVRRYKDGDRLIRNPADPEGKILEDTHLNKHSLVFLDRDRGRPIVANQNPRMPAPRAGIVMPDTGGLLLPDQSVTTGDSWEIKSTRLADMLSRIRLGGEATAHCELVRLRSSGTELTGLIEVRVDLTFPTPEEEIMYTANLSGFLHVDAKQSLPQFLTLSGPVYFQQKSGAPLPKTLPDTPGSYEFFMRETWDK